MISALVCTSDGALRKALPGVVKELTAAMTDEDLQLSCRGGKGECEQILEDRPLLDLVCCDITAEGMLDFLERLRAEYASAAILLVAGRDQSPLDYLRPGIRASSLLLKPVGGALLRDVVKEFLRSWLDGRAEDRGGSLVIKSGEGRLNIPCRQIYYVEAREKKLCVRLKREEYSFYGKMDYLQEELPERFIRCHRSYLVNADMIEKIRLSEQLIDLRDGFTVPVSRGAKAKLKELKL